MKPSLAISYALKKRSKKMADGGMAEDPKKMSGSTGLVRGSTEANQNQKGVHRTGNSGRSGGISAAGTEVRHMDSKSGGRFGTSSLSQRDHLGIAHEEHKQVLSDLRSMKKPNLLADGGQVQNPKDDVPEPNKKSAEDFQKGLQTPGTDVGKMVNNIKEGLGMADGGFIEDEMASGDADHMGNDVKDNDDAMMEDDLVSRIMQSRANQYSRGGMIANESGIGKLSQMADGKPNQFDDLALRDELESAYTGANSGDELGNEQEDHDRNDIVARIMASRRKKDRMPRPA